MKTAAFYIVGPLFLAVLVLGLGWQVGYFGFLGRKLKFNRRGMRLDPPDSGQPDNRAFERRSLIHKSRPLLFQGLLWLVAWILVMVVLFVGAIRFGSSWVLAGFVIAMPALIYFHGHSRERYLMNLVCTTPCPRCGKILMKYVARSKDERRLLVCNQCRTEWDLGSADL